MAPLTNARHEAFAQALAKGASQTEAYTSAGYQGDRTAASRLTTNVNVQQRVAELQAKAANKTVLTVASLTERLLAIALKGEGTDDASMLSVARASLMDAAKLNGLIVERAENTNLNIDVTDEPASEEDWAAEHATSH